MTKVRALERAVFDPARMGKATLARGERMMVGLNCLGPGQAHEPHIHAGQDKLYHVLAGSGRFELAGETLVLEAGELVLVPGGTSHGVANDGPGDLVVLVVLAPPPG